MTSYFQNSYFIVGSLVKQNIVAEAQKYFLPRKIVFQKCSKEINDIQKSIIDVQRAVPDLIKSTINSVDQNFTKKPTVFKVKQIIQPIKIRKNSSKNLLSINPSLKSIKLFSMNTMKSNKQLPQFRSKTKQKKLTQVQQKIKSYQKLYPCFSAHHESTVNKSDFKGSQSQIAGSQDQIIRMLRQSKLYQLQTKNKIIEKQQITIRQQQSIKKLKESQPKKYMAVSTDYDGFGVYISKNQLNRQIPHYIDVQINIDEQDNDKLSGDLKNNMTHMGTNQQGVLAKQFIDYKELKVVEKENRFVNSIFRKIKFASCQNRQNQDSNLQQSRQNKHSIDMTLSGKTYKPVKVGFSVYSKIKKQDWKIQDRKKQVVQQLPTDFSTSILKKNSLAKRSIKKRESQSFKQTQFDKKLKKSNIHLGNSSAINFLLSGEKKPAKKTVTIDQNFL